MSGLLSFRDIAIPPEEWPSLRNVVVAQELASRKLIFVTKEDSLLDVIRILHAGDFDKVPVVENREEHAMVLGYLGDKDILKYYHSLGMKQETASVSYA